MAITNVIDFTNEYNDNDGFVIFETSGWDSFVVQATGGSDIPVTTSNDGGAITGSIPNSPLTAINFQNLVGYDLSAYTLVSVINTQLVLFSNFGNYVQIGNGSAKLGAGEKLIVKFHKIG